MDDFKSYYRLFGSSWGILIGIKGSIIKFEPENINREIVHIINDIYIEFCIDSKNKYIHDNKMFIINAVRWVEKKIPDEKILITINEIDLNFCNFQIEGLFLGMADWICQYYNTDLPKFEYRFDKIKNKYFFWNETDKSFESLLYQIG